MREMPILFRAPMVRAILNGSKTQTRGVVKPYRSDDAFVLVDYGDGAWPYRSDDGENDNLNENTRFRKEANERRTENQVG